VIGPFLSSQSWVFLDELFRSGALSFLPVYTVCFVSVLVIKNISENISMILSLR
jgi:hypothetical protein